MTCNYSKYGLLLNFSLLRSKAVYLVEFGAFTVCMVVCFDVSAETPESVLRVTISFRWVLRTRFLRNVGKCFFFLIKLTRPTNFPNFILSKNLHVSGIYFAPHQEFSTVHSTLVCFLQV